MFKAYGLYKKARDASWQALIDNKISSLPVDVVKIANDNGISVIKNSAANELRDGEVGVSLYDGDEWFVIYDDTVKSIGRKRFTIAHELGHIFLGHPLVAGYHKRSADPNIPSTENEANIFASRLLAPACVLWGLNLHTAEEIAKACNLSMSAAQNRAERMEELYRRNKFLISPLEKEVYNQFRDFIEKSRP